MGSFAASSINYGCSAPLPFLQYILGEVQEMVNDESVGMCRVEVEREDGCEVAERGALEGEGGGGGGGW